MSKKIKEKYTTKQKGKMLKVGKEIMNDDKFWGLFTDFISAICSACAKELIAEIELEKLLDYCKKKKYTNHKIAKGFQKELADAGNTIGKIYCGGMKILTTHNVIIENCAIAKEACCNNKKFNANKKKDK
jgi:hypothetical protein